VAGVAGAEMLGEEPAGVAGMAGVNAGVGGPDDAGDGDSTIHMLLECQRHICTGCRSIHLPVRSRGHQFCDRVSQGGEWVDIEHRVRIPPIVNATFRQYHRDEMQAGAAKQSGCRTLGQ
jgi:hypothetical protein